MRCTTPLRATARLCLVLGLGALSACGGGGGGGSSGGTPAPTPAPTGGGSTGQPTIHATVISFPSGASPPGFVATSFNSSASVAVLNQAGTTPIATATVTLNGMPLAYSSTFEDYESELSLDPGAVVNLSVTVGGTTYTATANQFFTYPQILAPVAGTTWSSQSINLVSWSGTTPRNTAQFALGLIDASGNIVWPANDELAIFPTNQQSFSIEANVLPPGSHVLLVGIIDLTAIAGATPGSGLILGGFGYASIDVSAAPPAPTVTLTSLATSPTSLTLGIGNSRQLSVNGTYSDSSVQDLTTRATWSSSDPTKVTVSDDGLVTALAAGSAVVTSAFQGVAATTSVRVFQPNPSPTPPLSESVT